MSKSSGNPSGMPYPKNLRPKQKEVIDAFAHKTFVVGKLPTAYGKTLAAAGAMARLSHDGKCNRMLIVVPRRNQATQMAETMPEALAQFGIETRSLNVGVDRLRALRYHAEGSLIVFIVTIQSLLSSKTWETVAALLQTGKWFIFVDEHHHYGDGDEGKWTDRIKNLNHAAFLAMSATPNRHDGTDHFPDATISETYTNASEQGFVKKLSLHAYDYTIDAVTVDGEVIRLTTEELAERAGADTSEAIDAYMTQRKMRFSPKYVSPLVMFPLARINDLGSRGIRAQMLVQAMSCSHAQCVADQIKTLVPSRIKVDWVGTGPHGRPDVENDLVLASFCPIKDKETGRRPWSLDILVNVGMAGEGLDSIDVTEITFLTPANNTITNLQTIGRGARPMVWLPPDTAQPPCHVNVDTSSPLSAHIGRAIEGVFDDTIVAPEEGDPRDPKELGEYEELPEKLGWLIADMRLTNIRSEPMFKAVFEEIKAQFSERSDEAIAMFAERAVYNYFNRTNSQTAIHAQKTDQIESACSKIAGLVIRRMMAMGISVERTLAGDLRKRINTQKKIAFGSTTSADETTLNKHWEWLKALEQSILSAANLDGAPKWLR